MGLLDILLGKLGKRHYRFTIPSDPSAQAAEPTSAPTPAPSPTSESFSRQSKAFKKGGSKEESRRIAEQILKSYVPKTEDVPKGFTSPLLGQVDVLAEEATKYGLDPRLLPLLAISETQAMRPAASGTRANNPFNTMYPGTQKLYPYPTIEEAIRQYAAGIAGPRSDPSGRGYERYTQFQNLPQDVTIEDFISKYQNPVDDPTGQLNTLIAIARQLGL